MVPKKPPYIHKLKFVCTHCERAQEVEAHAGMDIRIGVVIQPHAGGGSWGRCCFCHKAGLRALEEPPRSKKGPVGWSKIPTK
jgi:hypothetical protein